MQQTAPSPETAPATEDQLSEFNNLLTDIRGGWVEVKSLPAVVKTLQDNNDHLTQEVTALRRSALANSALHTPHSAFVRPAGRVSDDCARKLASTFILHCARSGALEALASQSVQRD